MAGITGDFISVSPDLTSVTYRAGSSVSVIFPPGEESSITTSIKVWLADPTLHNNTSVTTDSDIELSALDFNFDLEGFTIIPGTDAVRAYVCVDWNWLPPWQCYEHAWVTVFLLIHRPPHVRLQLHIE